MIIVAACNIILASTKNFHFFFDSSNHFRQNDGDEQTFNIVPPGCGTIFRNLPSDHPGHNNCNSRFYPNNHHYIYLKLLYWHYT